MSRVYASIIVTVSACGGSIPKDLAPGKDVQRQIIQHDSNPLLVDYSREYQIYLPKGYSSDKPAPLFFYYHGWGDDMTWAGRMPEISDDQGWILVRPNGMSDGQDEMRSWNVGQPGRTDICVPKDVTEYEHTSCLTTKNTSICNCGTCYDDVRFTADLIQQLQSELCIDTDRIYASGTSFGAMFSYFLAPELIRQGYPLQIRAVLPWYGAFYRSMNEIPAAPTSVFHFHGDRDTEVTLDGSESDDGYLFDPVDSTLGAYAANNGCASKSSALSTPWDNAHGQDGLVGCVEWAGCATGRVVKCLFDGGHGIWPSYSEDMMAWFLSSDGPSPQPTPSPQPPPSPRPTPSPQPTPSPEPSPIPGGQPSESCMECWEAACSAKQTDCNQCMKTNKVSCVAICKPSLFGQKMMDWFCQSESDIVV